MVAIVEAPNDETIASVLYSTGSLGKYVLYKTVYNYHDF
jgi:hypothetical protein